MMKFLAVLALLVAVAVAQDLGKYTNNTQEFDGASAEVVALATSSETEITAKIRLEPTKDEMDVFNTTVTTDSAYQALDYLKLADVLADASLLPQVTGALVTVKQTVDTQRAVWDAYKKDVIGSLTLYLTTWNEWVANMTAERNAAVTDVNSLIERARATLIFFVSKVAQRRIAASVLKLREEGRAIELTLTAGEAGVFLINNTIAKIQKGVLDGKPWTVLSFDEIKERIRQIGVAAQIAKWRAGVIQTYLDGKLKEEEAAAAEELRQRIEAIKAGVEVAVDELKAKWRAAANLNASLAEKIEAFLENVKGVDVKIEGLSGEGAITVDITITRENVAQETINAVRDYLVKHITALLVATSGAKESDVSVEAKQEGVKRATNTWSATAQIGTVPADTGAVSIATSATLVFVAIGALFF